MKKLISIVTPCFNEEENVNELYERVSRVMSVENYDYELLFIDNASIDQTINRVKQIAKEDNRVKLIVNCRNFGHIRSPYHAILQMGGDACILIAADLQDPPEMIPEFIRKWESGFKTILAVKPQSDESRIMRLLRHSYYHFLTSIADVPLVRNATGAGMFDRQVIEILKKIDDPYPYFRGLVCEIGLSISTVEFKQPKRSKGVTKNNFFTLYDLAMLGITKHSKLPLRLVTMSGFILAAVSLIVSFIYLAVKIAFWDSVQIGIAPILIGLFFFSGIQLFFIGVLGEYVGAIYTQARKMPHVVELERVNFKIDDVS
jgi:glycosyltransferase involved in cell wall biosynthesis